MILVRVIYLITPLIVAGAVHAPVIKKNLLPALACPLDGGRTFRGLPIFGTNKTWRGLILMSTVSSVVTFSQNVLYRIPTMRNLSLVDYRSPTWLYLGLALGLGYSLAELPNSFLKRRLRIPPGGVSTSKAIAQYVGDQADSALGGTVALAPFVGGEASTLTLTLSVGVALHVSMDQLFYRFGVKHRLPQTTQQPLQESAT